MVYELGFRDSLYFRYRKISSESSSKLFTTFIVIERQFRYLHLNMGLLPTWGYRSGIYRVQ